MEKKDNIIKVQQKSMLVLQKKFKDSKHSWDKLDFVLEKQKILKRIVKVREEKAE